ncbi:hypothetical protein Tco_1272722 [Tanacetum coccineum]
MKVFVGVKVLTIQRQLIESTQGTHRTSPSAHQSPTLSVVTPQKKNIKQVDGETISPRKSLKVTIKQKKQNATLIPPPSDDRERDEIAKATLLSLALHKTAIASEAQENVAKVKEKLEEEEIAKMVEGDENEESYASEFDDSTLNDDDDFGAKIEPESHKEHPENIDDEDENEKKDDDHKKVEDNDDHTDHTLIREVLDHYKNVVPELTFTKTNEMLKEEVPRLVNLAVNRDREIAPTNVPELISNEFAARAPRIIADLFQKHMQNTTLNLYPTTSSSTASTSTVDIKHQLYLTMKLNSQDQAANPELWDILKAKFEKP